MSPELDHAEQVAWVWRRIVAGDRIRIFCDYYGAHWIELTPRGAVSRKPPVHPAPLNLDHLPPPKPGCLQPHPPRLPPDWALAPPAISSISLVIMFWRCLLKSINSEFTNSFALSVALCIAIIRAACSLA